MARQNIFINCKTSPSTKRRVMKQWVKQFLKYIRKPSNEFGYVVCTLARKWTYFPVNIFIDDGGLWTNIGSKKIILFQTNNDVIVDFDKILPMSIEDEPQILVNDREIDLTNDEIEQVRDFVRKCQTEIIQLADDNNHHAFFEEIRRNSSKNDSKSPLSL